MVQEGELRNLAERSRFPPLRWWTKKIHPGLIEGLRVVYEAYDIDPNIYGSSSQPSVKVHKSVETYSVGRLQLWSRRPKLSLQLREEEDTLLAERQTTRRSEELGYSSPKRTEHREVNLWLPQLLVSAPVAQPVSHA